MAPESCTVAVEINDHYVIIQFKSDDEVRKLYVHPDNVVLTSGKRNWSQRVGDVVTFHQNKYKARESIKLLCKALKEDRDGWKDCSVDTVMALICDNIGMEATLWTKIKKWVNNMVSELMTRARLAVGYHTGPESIVWK